MPRDHGRPRGRKPPEQLDSTAAQAEQARKQARKAKRRNDRANKRRKGHN